MENSPYWFKRRRYGYGWVPVTWQGWVTVVGYIVIVVAMVPAFLDAPEANQSKELGFYLLFVTMATFGLLTVTLSKGPRPRWRWGRRPDDDPGEDY